MSPRVVRTKTTELTAVADGRFRLVARLTASSWPAGRPLACTPFGKISRKLLREPYWTDRKSTV